MSKTYQPISPDCMVSVIIPALNEESNISNSIQAAQNTYPPEQVEVIVVDGGSTDETLTLVPNGIMVLETQACRAIQMNAGAAQAHGDVLLFCHADTQLPSGWRESVIEALNQTNVIGGVFQSRFEEAVGLLKWRNKMVFPADWRLMYGDQCQFTRRSTFNDIGGFQVIPLMEDVALSRSLASRGKLVRVKKRATTSSRRLVEKGILHIAITNVLRIIGFLYFGVSAEKITLSYRSSREENHERSSNLVRKKSI